MEYAKQDNGMPVSRARHAIGVIVTCSMIDRVGDTEGGHLFFARGGTAKQLRLGPPHEPPKRRFQSRSHQ